MTDIITVPLNDDREWENQCARCGSSVDWEQCFDCWGDGYLYDEADYYEDWYQTGVCHNCRGEGGWWFCVSKSDWCEANPLEGREKMKRGTIEWFPLPRSAS